MIKCYLNNNKIIEKTPLSQIQNDYQNLRIKNLKFQENNLNNSQKKMKKSVCIKLKKNFIPNMEFIEFDNFTKLKNKDIISNNDREEIDRIMKITKADQANYSKFQSHINL